MGGVISGILGNKDGGFSTDQKNAFGDIVQGAAGRSGSDASQKLIDEIKNGMAARTSHEQSAEDVMSPYMGDPRLQKQFEEAIASGKDPQELINNIMGGYKQSNYAQYLTGEGSRAINQQSAAHGLHGSSEENQMLQKDAMGIASGDMQQYLANNLGVRSDYLNRLGGIANNESQQQFGARTGVGNWRNELGNNLANDYGNLGNAEMAQQSSQDSWFNKLLGGAATVVGGIFGGL